MVSRSSSASPAASARAAAPRGAAVQRQARGAAHAVRVEVAGGNGEQHRVHAALISSVCARTAERPANSASSKASTVRPMGVTKPMPLTRTGAEAARAGRSGERGVGCTAAHAGGFGGLGSGCAAGTFRVDPPRTGAAAMPASRGSRRSSGNAQVEGVFHGEDELHQRQRVEAEVGPAPCPADLVGTLDAEVGFEDGGDAVEGGRRSVEEDMEMLLSGGSNVGEGVRRTGGCSGIVPCAAANSIERHFRAQPVDGRCRL